MIAAAQSGHRDAFETLVRIHETRLTAAMTHVTGNSHDAEEVTQEAFIRAFLKLDTFHQNSQFFTWLYRIAFNVALTRRRRLRPKVSLDQRRELVGEEAVDPGPTIDAGLMTEDSIALVKAALARLTDQHREILILREMEDATYEEIAEILQLSIGTVRSRLNRARKNLRVTIEAIEQEQEKREGTKVEETR